MPDATTLRRFRKIAENSGVTQEYFKALSAFLKEQGCGLRRGTIAEASLPAVPGVKKKRRRRGVFLLPECTDSYTADNVFMLRRDKGR